MAKAQQHSQAALIALISTTGAAADKPVPATAKSGRANAIISPSRWYIKKSVRPSKRRNSSRKPHAGFAMLSALLLNACRWTKHQLHIVGRRLQLASLYLPNNFDNARISGSRVAATLALFDDDTVDHGNLAGPAFQ